MEAIWETRGTLNMYRVGPSREDDHLGAEPADALLRQWRNQPAKGRWEGWQEARRALAIT